MEKIFSIRRSRGFDSDIKYLSKRFRTLEEDIAIFIDTSLKLYHHLRVQHNGIFPIPHLGFEYPKAFKVKKFACKALKGKGSQSGIRITYVYFEKENIIELVEIYFKSDKENEDKARLKVYGDTENHPGHK